MSIGGADAELAASRLPSAYRRKGRKFLTAMRQLLSRTDERNHAIVAAAVCAAGIVKPKWRRRLKMQFPATSSLAGEASR